MEQTPDWIRRCRGTDLDDLYGRPYMLRTSDDDTSPWRLVKHRREAVRGDIAYMTFEFWHDDDERIINPDDEIEVGLVRPEDWPEDAEPRDWPRPPDS